MIRRTPLRARTPLRRKVGLRTVSVVSRNTRAKRECDRLWSLIVRFPGACANCGSTQNLEAAHLVPRTYAATRHEPANGLPLDHDCHMWFTDHPFEFEQWCMDRLGYDYELLRKQALQRVATDYPLTIRRLRGDLAALREAGK